MRSPSSRRRSTLAVCGLAVSQLLAFAPTAAARLNDASAFGRSHRPVCGAVPKGFARCHSDVVTDSSGKPLASSGPSGYNPIDLQSAYSIIDQAGSAGATQTIAIVDAYDDPNAEADLGVYRSQFGLPPCTTANGCFRKVDQRGGTSYPKSNASWAQEISLDLDMASAICPNCHILLVEADSAYSSDLDASVDRAAALGATQISNSYGSTGEYSSETSEESHFDHPGIAITASSGDSGYGVEYPAASQYVTAAGGTSLTRDSSVPRGWSETAWPGAGSGCSAYITKPSWQTDSGCAKRTVADVSADADPNTGVSVYDSFAYQGRSGWLVFGGTSAAAPIVAGFDALIGSSAASPSFPYGHAGSYNDVTSGGNGNCGGSYLCTAKPGYDGPTGLGTPKGSGGTAPNQAPTAAFTISPNPAQTGQTVTFDGSGSSDSDGTITHYEWDLDGNGSFETDTGTSSSTTSSYASAQSITVSLRVTDNDGAAKTVAHPLTVTAPNQAPTAAFTISPNPAQTGQTVTFDGSGSSDSDGTITHYEWDLDGNGSFETDTGTSSSTTSSYASAQSITVSLRVTDNDGAAKTVAHPLTVTAPGNINPTAQFTMSPSPAQSGETVSFDASASDDPDGSITNYQWSFADGASATGQTTQHTYTTSTSKTYQVRLVVTDNSNATASTTQTISVSAARAVADVVLPVISRLRLSHTVFRAARSGAAIARVGVGARIRFTLSEGSTVTFRLQRGRAGRWLHGKCGRPTRSNRRVRRCTRWSQLRGKVRHSAHTGSNTFRFRGRWRGHKLTPGRYRLIVVALDAAGNRSQSRRVGFRIVR